MAFKPYCPLCKTWHWYGEGHRGNRPVPVFDINSLDIDHEEPVFDFDKEREGTINDPA